MSAARVIRTVLGDIQPSTLGVLDYHEHLFQSSPLLPGDALSDEVRSGQEATFLHTAGVAAMIEATPTGLGRDVEAVARISARSGLKVVHTTGAHHGGHYPAGEEFLSRSAQALAERFIADIVDGFLTSAGAPALTPDGSPVRAGLAKAGIRYWSIDGFESRALEAVAATSLATGCAIMVHLEHGSASHEVLDVLAGHGVAAEQICLAHIDRNLDPGLHASLAERGAYLGYDGMARHREAPDSAILECIAAATLAGAGERIVVGGDVARASRYRAYGGIPGLDYLPLRFLPRLAERIGARATELITVRNGARLLAIPA
jgi:phosphotriesterase-related protein